MSKDDSIIMVVERNYLFGDDYFEGFRHANEVNFEERILSNFRYMKRSRAEEDPAYKQPIAYCIITNPTLKQVFAYQRAREDVKYPEKRLQGKWSWGVGGHIERIDGSIKERNPIITSMLREIEEEIEIGRIINTHVLGYINNEDKVGRVHFGILYVVETNSSIVKPKSQELDNGGLRTISELEEMCTSKEFVVEEWSKISLNPIKKYFGLSK